MQTLAPILVATDGSSEARAAAAFARVLATREAIPVVLLHVIDPRENLFDLSMDGPTRIERAERELLGTEAALFHTPVRTLTSNGEPAVRVAEVAEQVGAGLVVIGTRGRGALGRAIFGSVAMGVLRRQDRPVLVVREAVEAVRHVVVGIDESPLAGWAVQAGRRVVDATGATLHLVHVLSTDRDLAARPEAYGIPREAWEQELQETADRVFGPHREVAGPGAQERLLFGWAPERLGEYARSLQAELLVVGRQGHSGRALQHPWSVGVALAMKGPCATLVV